MRKPKKKENMKTKNRQMRKRKRCGGAGGGPRNFGAETKGLAYDFYLRKHGGTCFYVSAETLSLESPFLKRRKLVPIRMQSSTAREAACASDSENFHELDSENVNAARVNFSMQMCFATYEYNCQRRWSKIVLHSLLHLNRQPHQRWRLKRNPLKKLRTWKAKRTKTRKRKKVAVGRRWPAKTWRRVELNSPK